MHRFWYHLIRYFYQRYGKAHHNFNLVWKFDSNDFRGIQEQLVKIIQKIDRDRLIYDTIEKARRLQRS